MVRLIPLLPNEVEHVSDRFGYQAVSLESVQKINLSLIHRAWTPRARCNLLGYRFSKLP